MKRSRRKPREHPSVTALIGICVVLFLLQSPSVLQQFHLDPVRVAEGGGIWTLFTYMFLHGNTTHLLMNMFGLYLLGVEIEKVMGPKSFLLMYVVSGVVGGGGFLVMSALSGATVPCVGASGAIFGVLGALVALAPNERLYIVFLPGLPMRAWVLSVVMVSIHLFFMFMPQAYGGAIAYDVHLFGGLAGFLTTRVLIHLRSASSRQDPVQDTDRLLEEKLLSGVPLSEQEHARLQELGTAWKTKIGSADPE